MAGNTGRLGDKRGPDLNLGWLAGSTVQPRKRQEIEGGTSWGMQPACSPASMHDATHRLWHSCWPAGVSAASILDLQAELYQAQEAVRLKKEGVIEDSHVRGKSGASIKTIMIKKNPGVEERNARDLEHVQVSVELQFGPCTCTRVGGTDAHACVQACWCWGGGGGMRVPMALFKPYDATVQARYTQLTT